MEQENTKMFRNNSEALSSDSSSPEGAQGQSFEPKPPSKLVRVLTVIAYVLSVSMAAILLSLYYVLMWDEEPKVLKPQKCYQPQISPSAGILPEGKIFIFHHTLLPFEFCVPNYELAQFPPIY